MWLQLPEGMSAAAFEEAAEECGVRFTAGHRCTAAAAAHTSYESGDERPRQPSDLRGYIRLSFSFYAEHELEEGARRLAAAAARCQTSE